MREALALARKGMALASPNPMVGAVVVRDGEIVGRGFHTYEGVRHAEVVGEELEVLVRVELTRREPGVVEEPPEVVPRVREVCSRRRGDAAGIDAAEDDAEPRREDVGAYLDTLRRLMRPGTLGPVLAGNAREPHTPGPPVVSEEQIRSELGSLFEVVRLHEFYFDQVKPGGVRLLAWSCLLRRGE